MEHTLPLPAMMLLIFGSAKLLAEIAERLGQPGIVGEILAGVLVGPPVLGWVAPNESLASLADLGVMFLLFRVGLETKASELMKVGAQATLVATVGVILPMIAGWGIAVFWGASQLEALFVGAAFVATSVGITAQVLSARGVLKERSSQIILAAAVIDDVLGLIVLAIVSGLAKGHLSVLTILTTAALPVAFTVIVGRWGTHGVRKVVPHVESRLRAAESQFHITMMLLFALAAAALYVGIAAIVGAFLAGMSLSEHSPKRVHMLVHGTSELLVPFFLAGIGLHMELSGFREGSQIVLAVIVLVLAVLTKVVGCGIGAMSLGRVNALRVGVGMIPRGEVGMVVAQLGLTMGALSANMYAIVVFAALATTVVAPPLLGIAFRGAGTTLTMDERRAAA